jgi:hypothetical protein
VSGRDWWEWHGPYDDPASPLSERLTIVQRHLRGAFDRCPAGPIRVISMCAGQGRDLLPVLAEHSRRRDVLACLVELDRRNIEWARAAAGRATGVTIDIRQVDAGFTDAYAGAVPAAIVLACGIFGNITEEDIHRTVSALPTLCAGDATVIWTRHRRPPDLTPTIRQWFGEAGFSEEAFETPDGTFFGVGAERFIGAPRPLEPGRRMFTFVGFDRLLDEADRAGL